MKLAIALFVAIVGVAFGSGYAVTAATMPNGDAPPPAGPAPRYQLCYPVDGDDVTSDRTGDVGPGGYGGGPEKETLDDEGEFVCVGKRTFERIRRQLGVHGKEPRPS